MERKYYVYEHREADTGRVFYIGKGFGDRAYRVKDRNKYWKRISKKHGHTTHIIYDCLHERTALSLEVDLISAYGRENLCNLTDGGEGVSNPTKKARMGQALGQASKDVFTFFHDIHGEFTGTCFELKLKYNLSKAASINMRAMCRGRKYSHVHGWRLVKEKPETRRATGLISEMVFVMYSDEYGLAITDKCGVNNLPGIKINGFKSLLYGNSKTSGGWSMSYG